MAPERARRSRRRGLWMAAAGLVALALVVRGALPWLARGALERELADATRSRVSIGDVDLGLLRGALRVEEIAFRAPDSGDAQGAEPSGAARATQPWLAATSFEVRISWAALWGRTLRVRSMVLVDPVLAVSRLEGGGLDLPLLGGESDASPTGEEAGRDAAAQEPSALEGWSLAIDDAALRDGRVRFRDFSIEASGPLTLDIDHIGLEQLSLGSDAYAEPALLVAEGEIEGAPLRAEASLRRVGPAGSRGAGSGNRRAAPAGWSVDASLEADGVPIRRVRFYLSPRYAPSRHWAELDGALDLDLSYQYATEDAHVVGGSAALRDVEVRVRTADDGAEREVLAWRRLGVEGRAVDLRERRVDLDALELEGARLLVRTGPDARLPLLASGQPAPPDTAVASAPPSSRPEAAPEPGPPDESSEPPWSATLGELRVRDSDVQLVDAEGASDEWSLEASAEDVALDGAFPVRLELAREEAVITADGRVTPEPPGAALDLSLEGIPLRDLARHAVGRVPELRDGTLAGRLRLATAGDGDRRLEVSGALGVAKARFEGDDAQAFALRWERVDAEIERVVVPLDGRSPPRIALAGLRAVAPRVRLRRTAEGWQLPRRDAQAAEPDPETEPPSPQLRIGRVEVARADVLVEDRGVEPFVRHELKDARASASDVRWPALRARDLSGELPGVGEQPLTLEGALDDGGLRLDVTATRVALPPLNPYVTEHSSYAVSSGAASLRAGVHLAEDVLDADLDLTLHDLGLLDGGDTFRKDFGVSLSLGMALLRDVGGDIHLSLPIHRDRGGVRVDLFDTVGNALHAAILNALVSPLKIAGAVVSLGGEVKKVAPQPVEYAPGEVTPTPAGAEQIGRLASLLASHPRLGLSLRPVVLPADRRAVAAPPAEGAGAGPQTPEALARMRVRELRRMLREDYGVSDARIVSVAEPVSAEEGGPRIDLDLAPLEEAESQAGPEPPA